LEISDLIAGPYQGPVACQLLARNQGVCWSAVNKKETVIVPNVHDFPGHIACDGRSNSEIVIPVFDDQQQVKAVLDIDSTKLNSFDETDKKGLEKIVAMIYR
jgi:GAF domain-containing protein